VPPGGAVVPLGRGDRVIEVRRQGRHLVLGEHTSKVEEPSLGEEVSDLLGVVIRAERPLEVERRAGPVLELDRPAS